MKDGHDLHTAFMESDSILTQSDAPQASDYLKDMEEEEGYDSLSESEKIQMLEALLVIMRSYSNLGHGFDPVNKLIAEFEKTSVEPAPVIDSEDAKDGE